MESVETLLSVPVAQAFRTRDDSGSSLFSGFMADPFQKL